MSSNGDLYERIKHLEKKMVRKLIYYIFSRPHRDPLILPILDETRGQSQCPDA
jgi:hypothetical protein